MAAVRDCNDIQKIPNRRTDRKKKSADRGKEREQNGKIEEEKERRSFQTVRRKKRWIRLIHFKAYFPCVKLYISFEFKPKLCTTFIILQR